MQATVNGKTVPRGAIGTGGHGAHPDRRTKRRRTRGDDARAAIRDDRRDNGPSSRKGSA